MRALPAARREAPAAGPAQPATAPGHRLPWRGCRRPPARGRATGDIGVGVPGAAGPRCPGGGSGARRHTYQGEAASSDLGHHGYRRRPRLPILRRHQRRRRGSCCCRRHQGRRHFCMRPWKRGRLVSLPTKRTPRPSNRRAKTSFSISATSRYPLFHPKGHRDKRQKNVRAHRCNQIF